MTWSVQVLTLFPEMFPGVLGCSLLGKAHDKGLWNLDVLNIRSFATDKHQTVDDTCFGGGPGMVMRPDIVDAALQSATAGRTARILNMSPRGRTFNQAFAQELSQETGPIVILCSRYEGIDQRVLDHWNVEDVSLGDFVLAGGELAAMTMIESCVRLIPGVLGDEESVKDESFTSGLLEYPHYTKPRNWNGVDVPEILFSGHHQKIAHWRQEQAEEITRQRRPDLWQHYQSMKIKGEKR
jgi:tRNA (guanine37-N1)-methyltransferase